MRNNKVEIPVPEMEAAVKVQADKNEAERA